MSRLHLKLWGVRGSTPTPQVENMGYGGNTPCLEVRMPGGGIFVFDAGTGARKLGQSLVEEAKGEPLDINIFLTHFHWDHIQGIPFFDPLYDAHNRVRFLAHTRTGPLRGILEGQMTRPYFPINFEAACERTFEDLSDGTWECGALRVTPFGLNHPQGATGFRIETDGASIVYATDHEHGDPEYDERVCDMARGADLLIYDSQYTPEEYKGKRGWGHSTWTQAVAFAKASEVKQVMLFHHDPSHTDEELDRIYEAASEQMPNTVMAREGWTLDL